MFFRIENHSNLLNLEALLNFLNREIETPIFISHISENSKHFFPINEIPFSNDAVPPAGNF